MLSPVLDLGFRPSTSPQASAERKLAAAVRWRMRLQRRVMGEPVATALSCVATLLSVAVGLPDLDDRPPGIAGFFPRQRSLRMLQQWGLRVLPGLVLRRNSISALLAFPDERSWRVVLLLDPGMAPGTRDALQRRVDAIRALVARHGVSLRLELVDALSHADVMELALNGVCVAGRVPESAWRVAAPGAWNVVGFRALLRRMTSDFRWLATLMAHSSSPRAWVDSVLAECAALSGVLLADPDVVAWAALRGRAEQVLMRQVLRQSTTVDRTARWALGNAAPRVSWFAPPGALLGDTTTAELLALGRELRGSVVVHARRPPLAERVATRAEVRERVGWGMPRLLWRTLASQLPVGSGEAPWFLQARWDVRGRAVVHHPDGAVFTRGLTPLQAQARAVWLVLQCHGDRAIRPLLPEPWRRLADARAPSSLALAQATGAEHEVLCVDLPRAGPIAAHRMSVTGALRWMAPLERRRRLSVEAVSPAASPLVATLKQVLQHEGDAREAPRLLQLGEQLHVLTGRGARAVPLRRALRRPLVVDELRSYPGALTAGLVAGALPGVHHSAVHCHISVDAEGAARLTYRDTLGTWMTEPVRMSVLELHLRATREMLQNARNPVALLLTADPLAARQVQRAAPPPSLVTRVEVWGTLPWGLVLNVDGELFSGGDGWHAAALAVSSRWPLTERAALDVRAQANAPGMTTAMACLWARSLVIRRMENRLRLLGATYQLPGR
ncbi:MAG: hypothetical protein AB2A00_03925 [Myxococcota bacterium]